MLLCSNLKCEAMRNPMGIDIKHPRLSWNIECDKRDTRQIAYQVIIALSPEQVQGGVGGFFDSGKVISDSVAFVLEKTVDMSSTRFYWSVRVWDNHSQASNWSEVQWFETGLLHKKDWVAKWIEPKQQPVIKEGFNLLELSGGVEPVYDDTVNGMDKSPESVVSSKGDAMQSADGDVPPELVAKLRELIADGLDLTSPATLMKLPKLLQESLPEGVKLDRKMMKKLPEILAASLGDDEASLDGTGSAPDDPLDIVSSMKPPPVDESKMHPCPMVRKEFTVKKSIKRARAYATAHGIYRLEINGKRVGDLEFMPEATPYDKYLQYQTYDVTDLIVAGNNAVGAILSDGWWAGRIGLSGSSCTYGDKLALLMQINIEYADGSIEKIGTNKSFVGSNGPIRFADLYMGEKYDANFEHDGWSCPGFSDDGWQNVDVRKHDMTVLVGQNAEPIRVIRRIKPVKIYTSPKGETIVDFGQCISGNAKFILKRQKKGQEIKFSYTQQIDKNGNYELKILMPVNNQHEDFYVCKGTAEEVYDPAFTYRGFRYVRVDGYNGELDKRNIVGRLIASDIEQIGEFSCSHTGVNQLQKNIQWTLYANLISIPTDNPDRERSGWTGDYEMIAATMHYNLNTEAFINRWMIEHRLEQDPDGGIKHFIPVWASPAPPGMEIACASGWGDNCIMAPWAHYQACGDIRILADNYQMMKAWMEYVLGRAALNPPESGEMTAERLENFKYIWNGDRQHGDWMTPSVNMSSGKWSYMGASLMDFTPCFYTVNSADLLVKIASLLGQEKDVAYFTELREKFRSAVIAEFFDNGYIMGSEFQGAAVLALKAGLILEDQRGAVQDRLLELIKENNGVIDVGFTSNEHILGILCDAGRADIAYDILLQDEMPSWLYMAKNGTTIWESWQAVMPDGTNNVASNIQYALANMGKWMYSAIGGIDAAEPGYKKIRIAPVLDPKSRIKSAEGSLQSPYGKILCRWKKRRRKFNLHVEIPANSTAEIVLPGAKSAESIKESGQPFAEKAEKIDGGLLVEIGSGRYEFKYTMA